MQEEIELKLDQPLLDLFDYCETYCIAGCCGPDAFEITDERVAQWVLDKGLAAAKQAHEQLKATIFEITKQNATITSERLNAWWPAEACATWLEKWVAVLNVVISKEK